LSVEPAEPGYSIERGSHAELQLLRLRGEFDLRAAPDLREAIVEALDAGGASGPLLVDMAGLDFLDSTIISVLLAGVKRAKEAGRDLRLAGLAPQVARILGVTGIDSVLPSYATVEEAASAPPGREGDLS
jgi:anti-sigma B factor antagonist